MRKKILSEQETRTNILNIAKELKCEQEIKQIFAKYDALLKNCTNDQERRAIATMGNLEIHRFISSTPGDLVIDGVHFDK